MRSAAADIFDRPEWVRASVSMLGDHGPCCDRARAWLVAMGRSHDFASTDGLAFAGPRWLTERWAWGPTRWPIAWCEAFAAGPSTAACSAYSRWRSSAPRASKPIPDRCCEPTRRRAPRTGGTSGRRCPGRSTGSARASSTTRSRGAGQRGPGARLRSHRRRMARPRDPARPRWPHRDPRRGAGRA